MDDFFLLPQDRTPERLAKPREKMWTMSGLTARFSPPSAMAKLRYTGPGSARSGCFGPAVPVEPGPLTVVEGSYSLHPSLRDRYQLRVWVEAPWGVRGPVWNGGTPAA